MQKNLKDSEESKAFGEFWVFYQKYFIPENNDKYWNDFIADAEKLIKKYKNVKGLRGMIMALSNANEEELNKK